MYAPVIQTRREREKICEAFDDESSSKEISSSELQYTYNSRWPFVSIPYSMLMPLCRLCTETLTRAVVTLATTTAANAAPFRKLKWYRVRLFFSAFNRNTRSVYPRVYEAPSTKRGTGAYKRQGNIARCRRAKIYCSGRRREPVRASRRNRESRDIGGGREETSGGERWREG